MNKKVLLDMYLNKNFGDDLFLKLIAERYPKTKFYVISLCKYTKNTFPSNVKIIRKNYIRLINILDKKLKLKKLSSLNLLKKDKDLFITLGGSMFIENNESEQYLNNYLYKKYLYKYIPYLVLGSNFGPYSNEYYYNEYKKIFSLAEDVCFRDISSYNLFSDLKNIRYAPDLIFSYPIQNKNVKKEKNIVISVINLQKREKLNNYYDLYKRKIIEIIKYFESENYKITLMSFCKNEGDDEAITDITKSCSNSQLCIYSYDGNIDESLKIFSNSEYIIATRFHSMILGFLYDKKVMPIIYSEKMKNVIKDLKFDGICIDIKKIQEFNIQKDIYKIKSLNKKIKSKNIKQSENQFYILDRLIK